MRAWAGWLASWLASWLVVGCESSSGVKVTPEVAPTVAATEASAPSVRQTAPTAAVTAAPPPRGLEKPRPDAPFVHVLEGDRGQPVDACLPHGGSYFSCRVVYEEATDPVEKRYLWRIAQGRAAGEKGYVYAGTPIQRGELPHAEMPYMCDPTKPCNAKSDMGELNGPVNCLARAFEAFMMGDPAAARAAHVHACRCGAEEASFPGYNSTAFICDDAGRPTFIAPTMSAAEGSDIVACAGCDATDGPAACQREHLRLRATDPALAAYVQDRHVPHCQTPNAPPR